VAGRAWSDAEVTKLRALCSAGTPRDRIAQELGRKLNSVRMKTVELGLVFPHSSADKRVKPESQRSRYHQATPPAGAPGTTPPMGSESMDREGTAEAETITSRSFHVRTLDELLAKAEVDQTIWEVDRHVINQWEMGAKNEAGEIVTKPLYQIKAWLRRNKARADMHAIAESLLARIAAASPVRAAPAYVRPQRDRHMLEVCIMDLHMGKLSWHEETGEDYDLTIAERLAENVVEDLLQKAAGFPLEQIVMPIGNDLVQVDNGENATTAGTRQDTDSRYAKIFERTERLLVWMLDRLAEVAPVQGVVVPGNHDRITAFTLGRVLNARYHRDARVEIDCTPKLRKYIRYGCNLIGYTHGNEEKHADLPLIMAQECPQDWAATRHREFHVGHLHKAKETRYTAGDSFNGVRVKIIPSLTSSDFWHYAKGYVHERKAAEAYVWSHDAGYVGHFSSSPPSGAAERLRQAA
jgi:hypothetical protein